MVFCVCCVHFNLFSLSSLSLLFSSSLRSRGQWQCWLCCVCCDCCRCFSSSFVSGSAEKGGGEGEILISITPKQTNHLHTATTTTTFFNVCKLITHTHFLQFPANTHTHTVELARKLPFSPENQRKVLFCSGSVVQPELKNSHALANKHCRFSQMRIIRSTPVQQFQLGLRNWESLCVSVCVCGQWISANAITIRRHCHYCHNQVSIKGVHCAHQVPGCYWAN